MMLQEQLQERADSPPRKGHPNYVTTRPLAMLPHQGGHEMRSSDSFDLERRGCKRDCVSCILLPCCWRSSGILRLVLLQLKGPCETSLPGTHGRNVHTKSPSLHLKAARLLALIFDHPQFQFTSIGISRISRKSVGKRKTKE